jgi:uncharacterized protein
MDAGKQNLFTGYGDGYVAVNKIRYERNVVVSPQAVTEWQVGNFEDLAPKTSHSSRSFRRKS